MSGTNYIASNWRVPENSNSSKNDNYSLVFDDAFGGEYITFNSPSSLWTAGSLSVSFWLKTTTTQSDSIITMDDYSAGNRNWQIEHRSSGNVVRFLIFSGSSTVFVNTSVSINDGNWHHLVFTYEPSTALKVYIDGSLDNSNTTSIPASRNTDSANLRIATNDFGSNYTGDISEVAIFDYALSSTQVSTLYGSSSLGAGNPMALKPTPVAYYPLGDNSASNPLTQPNVSVDDASVFDFNGSNNYINCGTLSFLNSTSEFTSSLWFNTDNVGTQTTLWAIGSSASQLWAISKFQDDLIIYGGTTTKYYRKNNLFSINTWYNLIVVYDGSQANADRFKAYLNGDLLTGATITGTIETITPTFTTDFNIGRIDYNAVSYFNGEISNVVFWNSDQSSEKDNIYNNGIPATSYTDTPVAWYKLDQSSNWEADTSGNWQIPDAVSAYPQSFSFNGTNQYVPIGTTSLGITSTITVSAWVKIPTTNTGGPAPNVQEFICEDATGGANRNWALNWRHQSVSNKYFAFTIFHTDGSVTSIQSTGIVPNDGNWHHVMGTFDGTTNANGLKLYVDGTPFQTTAVSTGIRSTSGVAPSIGAIENGSAYRFEGNLSNIAVWDSVQNIDDIYNSGTPAISYSGTPTAWWKLDNTAAFSTNWSVPDASGNGNTGTSSGMTEQSLVNNNVSTLNGESSFMTSVNLVLSDLTRNLPYENYSMDFDGTENINIGTTSLGISTAITISAWVKTSDTSSTFRVIVGEDTTTSMQRNWLLYLGNTQLTGFLTFDPSGAVNVNAVTGANLINDGEWHHVLGTWDGTTNTDAAKIFIDGVLKDTDTAPTTGISTTASVEPSIGSLTNGANWHWNGQISHVSVWDVGLSETEVLKVYANGLPQDLTNFTPQPISWWTLGKESFWNGSDWIVRDMISSSDGTSANMGVDSLTGDAPRSEANGIGANMDIPTNLVGNAGFSDKNAYSINMGPSARVTDTP